MTVTVNMPALSPTMSEGNIVKWHVKEGDKVEPGDIIAEVETDKATMEVEAADEGKVGKLLVEEGTEGVKVKAPIAILLEEGEGDDALENAIKKAGSAQQDEEEEEGKEEKEEKKEKKDQDEEDEKGPPTAESRADVGLARPEGQQPAAKISKEEAAGNGETKKMTVREALRDAMAEEMRRDEDVFLMGEEVGQYQGAYKVSQGLLDEFGEKRVIDTPITEHAFAGLGVGAAFFQLKPIIEFMTFNFAMQAMDHLINSAAKTRYMSGGQIRCQIVFRGPNGAASRVAAQHSQNFAAWYAHVPGLKVIAPYSAADAKGLLKAAIRDPNPVMFLEHELLYGEKFEVPQDEDSVIPIGKASVVRKGVDVTIVVYSIAVKAALAAAEKLAEEEIEAEVIDLRTLRPMDLDTVKKSLAKTNRLVVAEEGWPQCSIASEVSARVMEEAFDELDAPVMRVTNADVPMPYAATLEKIALVSAEAIIKAVKQVSYKE